MNGSAKDFDIFCQVLEKVNSISLTKWDDKKDFSGNDIISEAIDIYEFLTTTRYPLQSDDLDTLFSECKENKNLVIAENFYLPPLEFDKEFVPLLSINYNFRVDPPEFQFRLGMYRICEEPILIIRGFGFRFEKHYNSNHDYYHAQFTRIPEPGIECESPTWIAEHIPCIVLPANNPVSLLMSILISLYGHHVGAEFASMNIDGKYKEPLKYIIRD